jgi:hypothetical protein
MKFVQIILLLFSIITNAYSKDADEWTLIGKTANGTNVYSTKADILSDGTLRMFLKGEKEVERPPEGVFAMFKSPTKTKEYVDAFPVLINCKRKVGRNYVAGPLGSEFHVPWEPFAPGTFGAVAYNAFCGKK